MFSSMRIATYLIMATLMLLSGYLVFRVAVRRDYERKGKLSAFSTFLECLVFFLHANLSYTFFPARWLNIPSLPDNNLRNAAGLVILAVGIAGTIRSMIALGWSRTSGQQTGSLHRSGLYRYTRNPQIVAYGLAVVGLVILWPSIYGLGWILLYGALAHMMVRVEEEHLERILGLEYRDYCEEVPRYIPRPRV